MNVTINIKKEIKVEFYVVITPILNSQKGENVFPAELEKDEEGRTFLSYTTFEQAITKAYHLGQLQENAGKAVRVMTTYRR